MLGLERGDELGGGDEVIALLASVGVRAGLGGQLSGAIPVCDSGFEHLLAQPLDPVRDDGLADRCDREGQSVTRLAHGFFVGDP